MVASTLEVEQQTIPGTETEEIQDTVAEKPTKKGNPLMRAIAPNFLSEPRPLDFADGMPSDEFCYEKCNKLILQPLQFRSQKEWIDFCKHVWTWSEEAGDREAEEQANELLRQYQSNPKLIEALRRKIAD